MALTNAQYTVAEGTRVRIASADNMPQDVIVHEGDHASSTTCPFLGIARSLRQLVCTFIMAKLFL